MAASTKAVAVAAAGDRTSFVGHKTPEEISKMVKLLNSDGLDKVVFRAILTAVVGALEGKNIEKDTFTRLVSPDGHPSHDAIMAVMSGLYRLLQLALRLSDNALKQEVFAEDLAELKVPKEFAVDVVSAVFGSRRTALRSHAQQSYPHLPKLEAVDWRVDVGISTSVLNRLLEPTIAMHLTLSDSSVHNFEIPVAKFHELRYSVATLLKEMEDLEKRSILKIQE